MNILQATFYVILMKIEIDVPRVYACLANQSMLIVLQTFWVSLRKKILQYIILYFNDIQVQKLAKNEMLMVNIGSLSTGSRVLAVKADLAKIVLLQPVCTEKHEKIALSRRVDRHWRYVLLKVHFFLVLTFFLDCNHTTIT